MAVVSNLFDTVGGDGVCVRGTGHLPHLHAYAKGQHSLAHMCEGAGVHVSMGRGAHMACTHTCAHVQKGRGPRGTCACPKGLCMGECVRGSRRSVSTAQSSQGHRLGTPDLRHINLKFIAKGVKHH